MKYNEKISEVPHFFFSKNIKNIKHYYIGMPIFQEYKLMIRATYLIYLPNTYLEYF